MNNPISLNHGDTVTLTTDSGKIEGKVVHSYTGREKKQVIVQFAYGKQVYEYPFSRKTGKLYACQLPFAIKLNLEKEETTSEATEKQREPHRA